MGQGKYIQEGGGGEQPSDVSTPLGHIYIPQAPLLFQLSLNPSIWCTDHQVTRGIFYPNLWRKKGVWSVAPYMIGLHPNSQFERKSIQ